MSHPLLLLSLELLKSHLISLLAGLNLIHNCPRVSVAPSQERTSWSSCGHAHTSSAHTLGWQEQHVPEAGLILNAYLDDASPDSMRRTLQTPRG